MTYRDLRADIETYSGNSDDGFIKSINRFIRQAEAKIGMMVDLPAYTKTTQVTFVATVSTVSLSAITDFISVNNLFVPSYGIVEQKDTSFIREAYPDATEMGPPRLFAMQNDKEFLLGPTPDIDYVADLEYFGKWPSIVDLGTAPSPADQNLETFISSRFETALLNGTLYFANMYMKDTEAAQMFKAEMTDALGLVAKFSKGKAKADKAESENAANKSEDQS